MITENTPLDEAWRIAIAREKGAYQFYKDALEVVSDTSIRTLFEFLMKEEARHVELLEDEFDKGFEQEM